MFTRCDRTDWYPGISGVDNLPGDDGFEVRCDREAERTVKVKAPWGIETFKLCDGHVVDLLTEFPGLDILSNDAIAPASVSAKRGE